jgi:1-deoxy-D-xylulose-5-phosphate reductoisomerase
VQLAQLVRQTLEIIAHHPDKLRVVALAAGRDVDALAELAARWQPQLVALADQDVAKACSRKFNCPVLTGIEGFTEIATPPGNGYRGCCRSNG